MSLQQLNLDWIMQQLHKILQFMPLNGVAGDVLQRTVDGAAWQPISAVSLDIHGLNSTTPDAADELPIYDNDLAGNYKVTVQDILDMIPAAPVTSVNGQTGAVSLSIPDSTSDLLNDSGFVDAAGAAAAAPVQSVNGQTGAVTVSGGAVDSVNGQTGTVVIGKSDVGLGNVDNVQQYSASNPPPYPVTSVNGQTGDVIVSGAGLTMTSLWTGTFEVKLAFNVPLDLSTYKKVGIVHATESGLSVYQEFPVPFSAYGLLTYDSGGYARRRKLTINTSGISFENGETWNGSAWTTGGNFCIPMAIYGIK